MEYFRRLSGPQKWLFGVKVKAVLLLVFSYYFGIIVFAIYGILHLITDLVFFYLCVLGEEKEKW